MAPLTRPGTHSSRATATRQRRSGVRSTWAQPPMAPRRVAPLLQPSPGLWPETGGLFAHGSERRTKEMHSQIRGSWESP